LRALAEVFVGGRLSEEAFPAMAAQEIEAALTDVTGIGPWTARGFLLIALDRADDLPTDEELVQLSDRWRPDRRHTVMP
jgi:DNA-3-methyladenine glycosylase II